MSLFLPDCPYCRTELSYTDSFFTKSKSVYRCPNCDKVSGVRILPGMYKIFVFFQVISILTFLVTIIMGGEYCLLGIAIIFLVSCFFYILSPFMISINKLSMSGYGKNKGLQDSQTSKCGIDTETEIYSN